MKLAIVIFAILGSALAASIQNDVSKIPPFKRMTVNPIREPDNNNLNLGIINGNEVVPHSIPYQVYLEVTGDKGTWSCGGSLITPRYVLTAAKCLDKVNSVIVVLGAHDLRTADKVVITAKSFKAHRKFNRYTRENDIGIIELPEDVTLSKSIGLASLPSFSEANANFVFSQGRVSGWGLTSDNGNTSYVLREVNSTVISNTRCNSFYGMITINQICLSVVGERSFCEGDFGGPLVIENKQIGIASFGAIVCGRYPSAYTRISQYLDWIEDNSNWKSA